MRRFLTFALLGILGVASYSYSQDIPFGVKEYMRQLQNDPNVEYGYNSAKKWRFIDQNVQFQDWHVGLPAQYNELTARDIEMATKRTKFEDLIRPTNRWFIPIRTKGDGWVYHALVKVDGDRFTPIGCGQGVIRGWDDIRKKFPEESGVIPIFIDYPYLLVYFPHLTNEKKIFHITIPKWNDSMSKATSKSLDYLDDGKTIIPLLKAKIKSYKEGKEITDNPNNSKDTSGGNK
jgi:hypothetical protein